MKYLMGILLVCSQFAFAQKLKPKRTTSVPPPPPPVTRVTVPSHINASLKDTEKCYTYTEEVVQGDSVTTTSTIVSYGWSGQNARIEIHKKTIDAVKEKAAKEKGLSLLWPETVNFIDGTFKLNEDSLTITPERSDKYQPRSYKIVKDNTTKAEKWLTDENGHHYKAGKCPEPIIAIAR